MTTDDIFESAVRSRGDLAGVVEYDGETVYFYLYATRGETGKKVRGAIRILAGTPDFHQGDVSVRWDPMEQTVGLFIRGKLWAAFDGRSGVSFGGDYRSNRQPTLPAKILAAFEPK